MRLKIINETGNPLDTRVIDLDTGVSLPVTKIEIDPFTHENGWCPQVRITLPRHYLHLVSEHVTVYVEGASEEAQR